MHVIAPISHWVWVLSRSQVSVACSLPFLFISAAAAGVSDDVVEWLMRRLVLGHVESRLDWINVARFVRRQIDERETIVLRQTRIKSLSIHSRLHGLVSLLLLAALSVCLSVFFTDFMFWLMAIPSSV